jgi:hypothetical protein
MIKIIFIVIAIFFAFNIISQKGIKKLPWFFAGILFFPPSVIILESPYFDFQTFILFILLFVTFINFKWFSNFKSFPFKITLLFVLIAYLLIGLFDSRLNFFYSIYKPILLFFRFFSILFVVGFYVNNYKDIKYIYNKLLLFFSLFTIYGISNYITKRNEFYDFIVAGYGGRNFANDNMLAGIERFRVSSFSWHAIYYGFLLSMILMLIIFIFTAVKINKVQKVRYFILFILLIINLFLTNSRSPIFAALLSISIYILFSFGTLAKVKIFLIATITFGISYFYFPYVSNLITESTIGISTGSAKYENASSVSLRETQFAQSILIFNKNPIFGNGIDYITENLGYSSDENKRKSDTNFFGFESYVYKLIIEQGIVGIVANLVLLISLFNWHLKLFSKVNFLKQKIIIFNIACLVGFIVFIVATGDLGIFLFFMSFFSLNIKFLLLRE